MNEIFKKLPKTTQEVVKEIQLLFAKVDLETKRFIEFTEVSCPRHCGICCESNQVETTVLEMLPLACYLWGKKQADLALEKLSQNSSDTCIFFRKQIKNNQKGHCGIYEVRPLICRLFGFFTVKDKYGKYVYGGCKVIKKIYPASYQKVIEVIEDGFHPSDMTDFTLRVLAQGSDLGRKMIPINTAIQAAIEKIGFIISLQNYRPGPAETASA